MIRIISLLAVACAFLPAAEDAGLLDRLVAARRGGDPIAPFGATREMSLEEAYALQGRLLARLGGVHDPLVGYKIAYASEASQEKWGIPAPTYGGFLRSMQVADHGTIAKGPFHHFHIEAEVAFTLAADIDAKVESVDALLPLVASVHAGLDIPDNRFAAGDKKPADVIGDNCGAAYFAIGPAVDPADVDLDAVGLRLLRDGEEHSTAPSTATMGSPWNVLRWHANAMVDAGTPLRAGMVILAGTAGAPYEGQGDAAIGTYTADCGPLGRVSVSVE